MRRPLGQGTGGRRPDWRDCPGWLRLILAVEAGRLAAYASRLCRLGSGRSISGRVMQVVEPHALERLAAGKRIVLVSGTNGKTTTAHLVVAALRGSGANSSWIAHNADGANLRRGIVSALGTSRRARFAVLEADERVVAELLQVAHPEVLVLLNLSRDQLDRNPEVKGVARVWRAAIQAAGSQGPVVVANASDPLVVWAAETARRVIWICTPNRWIADAALCPRCDARLVRERSSDPRRSGCAGTRWHCVACGFAEPPGAYVVEQDRIVDSRDQVWQPQLNVPGSFNVSNAACALAAVEQLGVPPVEALAGMRTVSEPAGRFAVVRYGETVARLLLAKNPAGWAETLPLATAATVVLAIDSAIADGQDVSWLWDVDFEQLGSQVVIATGPRAQDLGVRLRYAEVQHRVVPDLADALHGLAGGVDVVATYTPFRRLQAMATR